MVVVSADVDGFQKRPLESVKERETVVLTESPAQEP